MLATELGREIGVPMRIANLALAEMIEGHESRLGRARFARPDAAAGGARRGEIKVPAEAVEAVLKRDNP